MWNLIEEPYTMFSLSSFSSFHFETKTMSTASNYNGVLNRHVIPLLNAGNIVLTQRPGARPAPARLRHGATPQLRELIMLIQRSHCIPRWISTALESISDTLKLFACGLRDNYSVVNPW